MLVIKILGLCCYYDRKLETEKNFLNHIIYKASKYFKHMENKKLFKTLAFSKIIHLTLVTYVPSSTIDLLNKMQKEFLWDKKNAKIKHTTLRFDYIDSGSKRVDIFSKIFSLQCSWVRRLFDNSFHQRKVIILYFIQKDLCKNF